MKKPKEPFVLDASMCNGQPPFCYCPVELDKNGKIKSVIIGLNFIGSIPPYAELVAVVHCDGQKAVEEFVKQNPNWKTAHLNNP